MRIRTLKALFVTWFTLFLANDAFADPAIGDTASPGYDVLDARVLDDLSQLGDNSAIAAGQEVINGVVVDRRDFPAIFGKRRGLDPNPTCTAALIGPSTMLIAAHCVSSSPRIRLSAGVVSVEGICQTAPSWASNSDTGADVALCLLRHPVTGIVYERVSFTLPTSGQKVTVSGFGCTEKGGQRDGKLRLGTAPIKPQPAGFRDSPGTLYTVGSIAGDDAVLCPGDSGGPLFLMGTTTEGPREVIGVNSATTFDRGVSLFAGLGAPGNRAFINDFAAGKLTPDAAGRPVAQVICGVNLEVDCKRPVQ